MPNDLTVKSEWPEGLVVDYAMTKMATITGHAPLYDLEQIAANYNVSVEFLKAIENDPEFVRQVRSEMLVLRKESPHLQKKATMLLEAWLDNQAAVWLGDFSDGSLADKLKVVEQITKISGLLEKNKAVNGLPQEGVSGPAVPTLNIVLTTPSASVVEKVVNSD